MRIKFWGVRGSIPTPLTTAEVRRKIITALQGAVGVDLTDPAQVRAYVDGLSPFVGGTIGGNTPCVEVNIGDTLIVFDAGSGLRLLGLDLAEREPFRSGQGTVHLLLSHLHWDHIQGFPFFAPAYVPGNRIFIYSHHRLFDQFLMNQQNGVYFPTTISNMRAEVRFIPLVEGECTLVGPASVRSIVQAHPGVSYGYRINSEGQSLVYATDAEYSRLSREQLRRCEDFMRGADLLIFDAQYTLWESLFEKTDWGHSSATMGVDLACRIGIKRLALFHHEPTYSDAELLALLENARAYQFQNPGGCSCEILIAYEGLTLEW
jgi:phosphoribosyl 1,2-cyclic phosphodiesterase